jgi:hypothetical protein
MLRNPAYPGRAVFGKTQIIHEQPGLNRIARLQGRTTPRPARAAGRPQEERTEIAAPAITDEDTFARVQQRLADNKRFATRGSKVPSLLQGLAACAACGYGYYRSHTTTTAGNKIYYYRCTGSGNYRHEGGRACGSKPVRADYPGTVVWEHITSLLADPALIRAEIARRLEQARTSDPVTRQRTHIELALAKAGTSITAMIEAYSEQLITIDELRSRMPGPARPRNQPARPARRPRCPGRRPRRLPQARRRPRRLPRPIARQHRNRHHRRPPARPAAAGQGCPDRPGEDHHPPPHPGPGTGRQRRQPPRHNRHGG